MYYFSEFSRFFDSLGLLLFADYLDYCFVYFRQYDLFEFETVIDQSNELIGISFYAQDTFYHLPEFLYILLN